MRDGEEDLMRSRRRLVRRKWPRWLTPNCISKPSSVDCLGHIITPMGANGNAINMGSYSSFTNMLACYLVVFMVALMCLIMKTQEHSVLD